jgi:diaminopimelate decarboxylase
MSRVAHPAGPRHADVLPPGRPPPLPADLNALDPVIWPRTARRPAGPWSAGVDVRALAAEFGTPLFACDGRTSAALPRFHEAFGPGAGVSYAARRSPVRRCSAG